MVGGGRGELGVVGGGRILEIWVVGLGGRGEGGERGGGGEGWASLSRSPSR